MRLKNIYVITVLCWKKIWHYNYLRKDAEYQTSRSGCCKHSSVPRFGDLGHIREDRCLHETAAEAKQAETSVQMQDVRGEVEQQPGAENWQIDELSNAHTINYLCRIQKEK